MGFGFELSMGDVPINLSVPKVTDAGASPAGGLRAVAEMAAELAAAGAASVLGVVIDTNGSTYRKRRSTLESPAIPARTTTRSPRC